MDKNSIKNNWRTFLMETEMTKHYKLANMPSGLGRLSAPNPILDTLLPSLLYIRLGALLDETFEDYIATKGLVMRKPYRNNFDGRITFLNDKGFINDASKLHELRQNRNKIAHEISRSSTWDELEEAVCIADSELQNLGLVESRPNYEFYAERSRCEQPEVGYDLSFKCCYGLKLDEVKVIEVSWLENIGKN